MINVKTFAFNMFQVNSLVINDDSGECIIIDPGCYYPEEKESLKKYITENNFSPVLLINTHCHVDHILGNKYVFEEYGLKPVIHKQEQLILTSANEYSSYLNLPSPDSPDADHYVEDNEIVNFGNSTVQIILTPGHTPGHISIYSEADKFIICGDVLFNGSIGRTDLPGGDYLQLMRSIKTRIIHLGDDIKVYSGHYEPTSIGKERKTNPFLIF
jgi:glyoxylase-like metal-dependent hydrolase (beta-lactamase superfamily II)